MQGRYQEPDSILFKESMSLENRHVVATRKGWIGTLGLADVIHYI